MISGILAIIYCTLIACITHEAGHYLSALMLKCQPKLVLKFPPVVTWVPGEPKDSTIIAISGFVAETFPAFVLVALGVNEGAIIYLAIYVAHLFSYPFRMSGKDENDFKWLV